jgi:hypothetical protein
VTRSALRLNTNCRAGQDYTIQIPITNGLGVQSSPVISICMTIESGIYDSRIPCTPMDYTDSLLMGVASGANPLGIRKPALHTEMEQTYVPIIVIHVY